MANELNPKGGSERLAEVRDGARLAGDESRAEAQKQVIAVLPAVAWLPIDTAPTDGTPVLVGWDFGHWECAKASYDSGWGELQSNMDFTYYADPPTHWSPLPEGPRARPLLAATKKASLEVGDGGETR
jgi:hypothetical protein